jgi:hypothetical protein
MFTLNWNDPQLFWLNVTNWILFLVTLACVAIIAGAVAREAFKRFRIKFPIGVREPLDSHALHVPELGFTMADGGEKIDRSKLNPRVFRKKS